MMCINLGNKLTKQFLEYTNNGQPSLYESFEYFARIARNEGLNVKPDGSHTFLSQFTDFYAQNGSHNLEVTEFLYDDVGEEESPVPCRGRTFIIHTDTGNFFLKNYQRRQERKALDRLAGSPILSVVDRYGWMFIEREVTGQSLHKLSETDPYRTGGLYGEILAELHRHDVVFVDDLGVHSQPFQGGPDYSFRLANSLAVDTCGCFLL